jgi:hypothetical protein
MEINHMCKYKILILLVFLTACSSRGSSSIESMPGAPISLSEMNKVIELRESLGMVDIFNAVGTLDFYLTNLSDGLIEFDQDFGSSIFMKTENGWEQVENTFNYSGDGTILPTKKQYPPGLVISVKPALSQKTRPITLRILVLGTIADTGKSVGAYIDVLIK